MDIKEKVLAVICEQFGIRKESINLSDKYETLGADSLDSVELTMALEENFDIEIPDDEAERFEKETIQSIVDYVEKKVNEKK